MHYAAGGFNTYTRAAFVPRYTAPAYTDTRSRDRRCRLSSRALERTRLTFDRLHEPRANASRVGAGNRVMVGPSEAPSRLCPGVIGPMPSARTRGATVSPSSSDAIACVRSPGRSRSQRGSVRSAIPRADTGIAAPRRLNPVRRKHDRGQGDEQQRRCNIASQSVYSPRPDPSAGPGIDRSVSPDYRPYAVHVRPLRRAPTMSPDAGRQSCRTLAQTGLTVRAPIGRRTSSRNSRHRRVTCESWSRTWPGVCARQSRRRWITGRPGTFARWATVERHAAPRPGGIDPITR
jgi:hypothetical protein